MHGVADAVIAPAMAAGTGDAHVEAPAGQRLAGDVIGARSIQDEEGFKTRSGGGAAQIAHSAQVAFAFLADIRNEDRNQG